MILHFDQNKSKVRQLVDAIGLAIARGEFKEGDILPSINKISAEYSLARDTVYKAFQDLKGQGLIESAPTKGYFVSGSSNNIFVLLDTFNTYKEDFYTELLRNLPSKYKVSLHFHQYNEDAFNRIIIDNLGKHDLYLITNLSDSSYPEALDRLDNSKVLMLDFGNLKKNKFSYISQEFGTTLYECLDSSIDKLKEYTEVNLIFNPQSQHPESSKIYFEKFCEDNNLKYSVSEKIDIKPSTIYITTDHKDMIEIVKTCQQKQYQLGKDIGLITFNESPMLEVIGNGISSISTDYKQMGLLAAQYLEKREKCQIYVPTQLMIRGSL